jgi:hypothetical protein
VIKAPHVSVGHLLDYLRRSPFTNSIAAVSRATASGLGTPRGNDLSSERKARFGHFGIDLDREDWFAPRGEIPSKRGSSLGPGSALPFLRPAPHETPLIFGLRRLVFAPLSRRLVGWTLVATGVAPSAGGSTGPFGDAGRARTRAGIFRFPCDDSCFASAQVIRAATHSA